MFKVLLIVCLVYLNSILILLGSPCGDLWPPAAPPSISERSTDRTTIRELIIYKCKKQKSYFAKKWAKKITHQGNLVQTLA